jgi:hypothetical protein
MALESRAGEGIKTLKSKKLLLLCLLSFESGKLVTALIRLKYRLAIGSRVVSRPDKERAGIVITKATLL